MCVPVSRSLKSRLGVTTTWARRISSATKAALSLTPSLWNSGLASAQA